MDNKLDITINLDLTQEEWLGLMEAVEFASLTYKGVANEAFKKNDLVQATNAATLANACAELLDKVQSAGISTSSTGNNTVH